MRHGLTPRAIQRRNLAPRRAAPARGRADHEVRGLDLVLAITGSRCSRSSASSS